MKKAPTIFLRLAIIGFGGLVLLFSIFLLPQALWYAADYSLPAAVAAGIGIYGASLMFYLALFQGFRLLGLVDKNKAFSKQSVRALKVIKIAAFVATLLFAAALPLFYTQAQAEDAPGLLLIALAINGVPFCVGIFAGVVQRLLGNVIDMKKENDLTV